MDRHLDCLAFLVLVGSSVAGACSAGAPYASGTDAGGINNECIHASVGKAVEADLASTLPAGTVEDWVTFSDGVAVLHVVSEDTESSGDSDFYKPRRVRARVEQLVWEFNGRAGLLSQGDEIQVEVLGWTGTGKPLRGRDSIRWTVGATYFVPLVELAPDQTEMWAPLTPDSVIPTDGARLESEECMRMLGVVHSLGSLLLGMTISQAAQLLQETRPDPAVGQFEHLPPAERFRAASE